MYPPQNIIGNAYVGVFTINKANGNLAELVGHPCYTSKVEPKNVKEALLDDLWIKAMQDKLGQFERNHVWDLVPRPEGVNIIGTKWIFKNKINES